MLPLHLAAGLPWRQIAAGAAVAALADSAQWDAITLAINGPAMMHADDRLTMTERALTAFV